MLFLAVLAMFGREGDEDEVRFIRRPKFKWIYRIGGIVMLLVTMNLAGVI
jgi:ABC-type Fe3+ transport system permease subunit